MVKLPFLQHKNIYFFLLLLIILVGVFFRSYDLLGRFEFAHDGDLYSWIVKDIVVNHHPRLIGQLTSAPGIFIGPLFYYTLIPFFLIANMDPIGAAFFGILIGIASTLSLYFVLSKLFNKQIGLIAAFLDAILITSVSFDRWIVPTIFIHLWAIWYFYILISIVRKNYKVFPFLGILIGLIWHVHIALIPTLLAIPIAMILSKKLPTLKQFLVFIVLLLITSSPLLLFEIKHNFQQTTSLIDNFKTDHGGSTGIYKLNILLDFIVKNTNTFFLNPYSLPNPFNKLFALSLIIMLIFATFKKVINRNELIVLFSWVVGLLIFFTVSSTLVSEYYLLSIEVIFIFAFSSFLFYLLKNSWSKVLVLSFLGIVLISNLYNFIPDRIYHKGYLERKQIVQTIKKDITENDYPCVAISYITSPGENVGFRYLVWLENIHLNKPGLDVPTYNIVIPDEYVKDEINFKYGHIGLILPKQQYSQEDLEKNCQKENTNLTEPVLGYTE